MCACVHFVSSRATTPEPTHEVNSASCLILSLKYVYICNIKLSTTCHAISWEHTFSHVTHSNWSQGKHFAWPGPLLWATLIHFPISARAEKRENYEKSSCADRKRDASPVVRVPGQLKYLCEIVCVKKHKVGFAINSGNLWLNCSSAAADDTRHFSAVWWKIKVFVQSAAEWWRKWLRGGVCVYELNKRVSSCTVVSTTRARLKNRKRCVTSKVRAWRQPLHWSSVALIACRSSASRKPLMWWMNEGRRAALWALIVFLLSHHIANTNLDRQRQTRERPTSHSPSQRTSSSYI